VVDVRVFAPCALHLKYFFGSNLPEINHSPLNSISRVIISLAQFFFSASILPAIKKTDCTNAGATLELPQWSGLQFDDSHLTCAPVCGCVFGFVSL
jgi:hypothetical protein